MPIPRLAHEELDVYQVSIDFLATAMKIRAALPRGYAELGTQLDRAALSIVLNIAEGYGKRGDKDRMRSYDISRGSAHECGAVLDAGNTLGLVPEPLYQAGKTSLHRVVSMLVKLCRST
jgi:four helix bundle protein